MTDLRLALALNVAFALLVTAHVTIVVGLAWARPRWHALAALVVPPLAPYWAARARMRVRAGIWIAAAVGYAAALALALRG